MRWPTTLCASLLVALTVLAGTVACGGGPAQPAGSTKVTMSDFKFDPSSPSVAGGKVVFYLVNNGSTGHDMVITRDREGTQVVARSSLVAAGDTLIFTADLASGSYFIRCDVPGHADSGMVGSLKVA